jgi:hypothetical protein
VSASLHEASFAASLAPVTDAQGNVGLGTFIRKVADYLKSLVHQAIDTEAERDELLAAFMAAADRFVGPKFGPMWSVVRPLVNELLDERMDVLPEYV